MFVIGVAPDNKLAVEALRAGLSTPGKVPPAACGER